MPDPCKSREQPNRTTSPPLASKRQKGKRAMLRRPMEITPHPPRTPLTHPHRLPLFKVWSLAMEYAGL